MKIKNTITALLFLLFASPLAFAHSDADKEKVLALLKKG